MPAFHQIGHDSENLLFEAELARFGGAILSPLNYTPEEVKAQVVRLKDRLGFVTVLDPHLYRPQSDRLCLPSWSYYPKDVDTADLGSGTWWAGLVDAVAASAVDVGPTAVCSPAIVPKVFSEDFYLDLVNNGNRLEAALRGTQVSPMLTVVVNLPELSALDRVMSIASIVSRCRTQDCLLVMVSTAEPRRELADPEELKGVMRLIATLEGGGQHVTVGFSSSDMILWKAAGATNCATGKFFNLRRFTLSRFDEPGGGGGQLEYWAEESLLAFLRQSDLLRIQARELLSDASKANPYKDPILSGIPDKKRWLALGWRQFMYWFAETEYRLSTGAVSAEELIRTADDNWAKVEAAAPPLFMEERQNDGSWVRQWRRALAEFPYFR
jgi:hypothetical protein